MLTVGNDFIQSLPVLVAVVGGRVLLLLLGAAGRLAGGAADQVVAGVAVGLRALVAVAEL